MAQKQNQQSPPSSLRNLCVSAVDCIGYRRGAENAEATPQNDAALLCSHRALYLLNFDTAWHQQAIDSVQVLSVEEANLDSASTVSRLEDLHLSAECPSEFRFRSFDIRVDRLRSGSSGWLLFSRFLNELLSRSNRQSTIEDLPRESTLEVDLIDRQQCSSMTG